MKGTIKMSNGSVVVSPSSAAVKKQFGKDAYRAYIRSNKAWYGKTISSEDAKEIMIGIYHKEGGTSGEMSVVWNQLAGKMVPQLKSYDDSWKVLASFADVIQALAVVDGKNITDDQFCDILDKCGFKDDTAYENKRNGGSIENHRRRWIVVDENGKQALFPDFGSQEEAEQSKIDFVNIAKSYNTKEWGIEADRRMRWQVVKKPESGMYVIQYYAKREESGKIITYGMMKEIPKSDYPMWEKRQKDGQITNLEILSV